MKQYHILIAFSLLATIGLTSCGDRPQNAPNNIATPVSVVEPVSYTHLDVYKRQTGLDPEERIRFRNLLSEVSENDVTIILSTHIVGDISLSLIHI